MISVRKRGKKYQYCFEAARVNGKRKQITKCGFRTKNEAYQAGLRAYNEYQNGGCITEAFMSYGDYLDYWLKNYCEVHLKYRTIEEYSVIVNKYLKPFIGHYRLNSITSYQLNKFLTGMCIRYNYSYGYLRTFVKVIRSSFRVATDIFGFIKYNPSITLRLPKYNSLKKNTKRHIYSQDEIDKILNRFKKIMHSHVCFLPHVIRVCEQGKHVL